MENVETANCYCFNASCGRSIFSSKTNVAISYSLLSILSGTQMCEECNSAMVSKPLLQMQNQINKAVENPDMAEPILFIEAPIFS